MGYTHYYQQHSKPTEQQWANFTHHVKELIEMSWDIELDIEITTDLIAINGVGDESHETFLMERGNTTWDFCKTARKPYDQVVTAVLILARYTFPDYSLSSDGDWEDWSIGRDIFTRVIHLEPAKETVFGNENHIHEVRSLS